MSPNQTQPPTCWSLYVVFGGRDLQALFTPQSLQGLGVITDRNPEKKIDGLSYENKRDPQQKMLTNRLLKKKNCPSLVFQLDTDDPIVQGEKKTQLVSLLAVRQAALPCTYHAFHPTEDVLMKERRKVPRRPATRALVRTDKPAASLYMTWHELVRLP